YGLRADALKRQEELRKATDDAAKQRLAAEARQLLIAVAHRFEEAHQKFSNSPLASRCLILAGTTYADAHDYAKALAAYDDFINTPIGDPKNPTDLRPMAMYWSADTALRAGDLTNARKR